MANTKWRTVAGLILALGLFLISSDAVAGDSVGNESITVVENRASHSFGQHVTFTLRLTSQVRITRVLLFFQATGNVRTESAEALFEQKGDAVNASYLHLVPPSPLPPFATITYWWQIEYGEGEEWTTGPQQFEYTDNRFQWKETSDEESHITVYWIEGEGNAEFGQAALDIARASLEDINAELRAPLPESVSIYIYDTQQNLDQAMVLSGRDWVGGEARPELGVIVAAIPANDFYASRMERDIPHELTHLLVYQAATPGGYAYVPEWLDEGLATANERLPTAENELRLEEAYAQGQLIPLLDLCVPFSPNTQAAYLSYAQSGSVVKYIRQQYGARGIRDLLAAYANGASCASGVKEALGISLSELETAWEASLEPPSPWEIWVKKIGVWVGLWLLGLLAVLPMIGRLRRRR
jgi:hypothetical protein